MELKMIHAKIKEDLQLARKNKTESSDLIYILGELSRLIGSKDGKSYMKDPLTDEQSERVLLKILASEEKLIDITGVNSSLVSTVEKYLPEKIHRKDIVEFLNTVDFSSLNNKMQAVGLLKKKFGTKVDGKLAAEVVKNYES